MIHNPLSEAITRTVRLPVYYTGLRDYAVVREKDGAARRLRVDRDYGVEVTVTVPGKGLTWVTLGAR